MGPRDGQIDTSVFKEVDYSHRGSILIYNYTVPLDSELQLVSDLFERIYTPLRKLLSQLVEFFHGIRVSLRLILDLQEVRHDIIQTDTHVGSPFSVISHRSFIDNVILDSVSYIILCLNLFVERGSEWRVVAFKRVEVHIGTYQPIQGRGYLFIYLFIVQQYLTKESLHC